MMAKITPKFSVGDRVHSIAVGSREAFDGEIVGVWISPKRDLYYYVRDDESADWHRSEGELTTAPLAEAA